MNRRIRPCPPVEDGEPADAPARERMIAALEADSSLAAEIDAVDPVLIARLTAGAGRRIAPPRRLPAGIPAMRWGALAACAVFGVWVGWTAQGARPPVTLLAAVQITPIADPPP